MLRKTRPIHLAIAGEGPMRRDLPREIERLGLTDCVTLLGHRTDVPNLLASLDVLVLPSYAHEGIPQIILQAQAMARPIVATRIGGIPEVVENNVTGLLVEPKEAAALAAKISALLVDRSLADRLRHAGRAQIEAKYSLDAMGERLLALYEKLWLARPC
jgi:glycosyltransferase involved in cell wall biosynthesis